MPIACDPSAIPTAERSRYGALMRQLHTALHHRTDLSDGYSYTLDTVAMPLAELGAWMSMERLCCPFLHFQLSSTPHDATAWLLALTGPPGVHTLLDTEFPQ